MIRRSKRPTVSTEVAPTWPVTNHRASAIAIEDVHYAYPDGRHALNGIDLAVARGERVAVLGPNGAGKTTLALHLNGILTPTQGTVAIDGVPIEPATLKEVRRRVAMVFQDPDDQLFMPTVGADVAFGPANMGVTGLDLERAVLAALSAVGIERLGDRAPHHLSFGQRRRAALATVLAMDPTVLVLDEPSSNLDPVARRQFAEVILGLELTTLLITHDLLYALQLCPRAVIVNHGRIVAEGPTRQLLADRELMERNRLELPYGVVLDTTQ